MVVERLGLGRLELDRLGAGRLTLRLGVEREVLRLGELRWTERELELRDERLWKAKASRSRPTKNESRSVSRTKGR